jgi:hypothetical protein
MRAVAVTTIVFALIAITGASAQQPPAAPIAPVPAPAPVAPAPAPAPAPPGSAKAVRSPQAPRPVTRGSAPSPAPAAPAPPGTFVTVEPNQPGQLVNIQIDIALVSEGGAQPAARKTVTLTLADKQEGSVRSMDRGTDSPGSLNVDAPVMQANGLVLTRIGLEFSGGDDVPFVQVRAQPLLQSGRALRISRAVSPKTDRSVVVEVTATVLK